MNARIDVSVDGIRALLNLAEFDRPNAEADDHPGRSVAMRRVPPRLLDLYQRLRDAGRVPPLVAIDRGHCSGCHLRLPTMFESRARQSSAVHRCPHCLRMLYVPGLIPVSSRARRSPAPTSGSSKRRS